MNSNEFEDDRRPIKIRLDPKQFKVLFQITKEFRSLLESRLPAIGVEVKDVDQLLELARSIRAHREGASQFQLDVNFEESPGSRPPVTTRKSTGPDGSITIHGSLTRELLTAWGRLSEAAIVSLGSSPELYYRTGYYASEIREVTVLLDRAQQSDPEHEALNGDAAAE